MITPTPRPQTPAPPRETLHTKGEWVGKDRSVIAKCLTGEWKNIVDRVRGSNPVEADANTRLIAAAPDLFAAVKALLAADGCPMCDFGKLRNPLKEHWDNCPFVAAQAALGKVEGND